MSAVRASSPGLGAAAARPARSGESGWQKTVRRFRRSPLSVLGLVIVAGFVLLALAAPYLAHPTERDAYMIPHDGYASDPRPPVTAVPPRTTATMTCSSSPR